MAASADSSVPTKVLSVDRFLFVFSFNFSFYYGQLQSWELFRKWLKMKMNLLFTMIYPKINMNVVKAILPQQ